MPIAFSDPDGERDGVPLWLCPNCNDYKPLQEYAWKKRKGYYSGQVGLVQARLLQFLPADVD